MTLLSASSAASSSSTTTTTATTKLRHPHLFPPHSASSHASRASTPSTNTPSSSTSPAPSSTLSLPLKSAHQHHGVRAHLAELLPLPRHALFDVKLTIHQLWNVPLVAGEFSVKWKFQHVHRERVGGIRRPGTPSTLTSSGRFTPDSAGFLTLTNNSNSGFGSGWPGWSGSGLGKGKGREVLPPAAAADHDSEHDSAHSNLIPSGASMLSIPSTSEGSSSSPSLSPRRHSLDLLSETRNNSVASASANGFGNSDGNGDWDGGANGSANNVNANVPDSASETHSNEARGRTPYVALRDHHVKWGQTVHVTVQIAVQRDTLELQPCELKLVVEQLTNPSNSSSLSNPRLGAVYLNLAEYVDKGPVMRRHLLRQSKTNATLQLSLELTHAGGESNYKAPPLQKGEVMAGVSALLEKSAVGGAPRTRPAYDRTVSRPPVKMHRRGTDRRDVLGIGLALGRGGRGGGWNTPTVPMMLGPSELELELELEMGGPGAGALKTTENIIEAIFNPVPSSSSAPSPFTYYVPPNPRPPLPLTPSGSGSVRSSSMQSVSAGGSGSVSISAGTSGEVDLSADVDDDGEGDGGGVAYAEPDSYEKRPPSIALSSARSDRSLPASVSLSTTSSHHEQDRDRDRESIGGRLNSGVNVNANASANVLNTGAGASGGKKWWKKFSGISRPASPAPAPSPVPVPAPAPSSSQLPSPSPIPGYGLGLGLGREHGGQGGYGSEPTSLPSQSPRLDARTGLSGSAHTHTHNSHSVRSSPGVLLHENEHSSGWGCTTEINEAEDDSRNEQSRLSAPQIVVRSPTSAAHSPRSPQSPRSPHDAHGVDANSRSIIRRPS
ncbi:hypothetical protein ACEPAI_2613 [Sanghuangporus weigelae]